MSKKTYFLHPTEGDGPLSGMLVVLWHGAGGDVDQVHLRSLAKTLPARGATVVRARFPYRVAGKRAPDRMPKLIVAAKETLDEVLDELDVRPGKIVLGGRSMGGRMTTMLVAEGYAVDGLVLLSYPLHPAGKPEKLRDAHLPAVTAPMLFVQGGKDALCRMDLLEPVLERLGDRATLSLFERADHGFGKVAEAEVDEVVGAWLAKLPAG